MQVIVGGYKNVKELRPVLEGFEYSNIQRVENEIIVNCRYEEHGLKIARHLVKLGKRAYPDYIDMLSYLQACTANFVGKLEFLPFFKADKREVCYSMEQIKDMYESHVVRRPKDFDEFTLSVLTRKEHLIKLLERE